jgi:hypothetical protein
MQEHCLLTMRPSRSVAHDSRIHEEGDNDETWYIDYASESQPLQSSVEHDSGIHEDGDNDGDDDGDEMTEGGHTPLRTNEITSIAMEWEGELNSVSLS